MGVSTNAIVFYGYCWSEEIDLLAQHRAQYGDGPEWDEILLRQRGEKNPWDDYPSMKDAPYEEQRRAGSEWVKQNDAALDLWRAKKKAIREEFGCDIGYHCSGECPMPYVYIAAMETKAYRGCPEKLSQVAARPEWQGMLDRFLSVLGIEKPEGQTEPSWWLVSYWG